MWRAARSLWQLGAFVVRVPRLAEASGPRAGRGTGLRVLILGDSSATGMGVATQDQALAGQVVSRLGGVQWQLLARSGATTAQARIMLEGAGRCDVAITALGVNDVLRHTRTKRFLAEQTALLHDLRAIHGARLVIASAVPPLGDFPTFPDPLNGYLGARALRLDQALQTACHATGAVHLPFDLTPSPEWLARDGLHPSAQLYAEWGRRIAGLVLREFS
jgi:lysophospholipase L1-like esterase